MSKLNIFEKMFPAWAAKREYYKNVLIANKERNYNAAKKDRLNPWIPANASAEQTDAPFRSIVRARARDLERNSDGAEAIIGAMLRNVIGTGIRPQARVKKENGEYDKEINTQLEEAFKEWASKKCDITGQQTFYELQEMILRRRIVDGEILIRKIIDPSAKIPFKLQVIEPDLLDSAMIQGHSKNKFIISGVEINEFYKPLAYWIYTQNPDGFTTLKPSRISADQIVHLFKKIRPSQVRGVSELARVIPLIKDTGDYLDAELVAARIAASFAAFVTRSGSGVPGRTQTDAKGNKIEEIYPGMIEYLQPGEDIRFANPGRNGANVGDYTKIQDRRSAAGMGLSYEVVTRDMSQTNYSSARQNNLEDQKSWIPAQFYIIEHFCKMAWEGFVTASVLSGRVNIPNFWNETERYFVADWIAPGWTWVDPIKGVKASKEEIKGGINTISQIAAQQGRDWQEVLEQAAREKEYAESLGLSLDVFGGEKSGK